MVGGDLTNNGTVSPGTPANPYGVPASPFGTLTVTGAFTSNAGSTLDANVTAGGAHNQLLVGTAALNGGSVDVTAAPGLYAIQTDYRIVGANGAVTGAFTGVNSPSGLSASLVYDAHDAFLRLRRTSTGFGFGPGLSFNEAHTAGALDAAVGAANPAVFTTFANLYNTLIFAPAGSLKPDLTNLSGDALTVANLAAQTVADRFHEQLGDQAAQHVRGPAGDPNVWASISRVDDDFEGDNNGPGFNAHATEFAGGVDFIPMAGLDLGAAVGASKDDFDHSDRDASGKMDSWMVGGYGRYAPGQFYLAGQVAYDWHHIKSRRALLLGGVANADYHAHTWSGSAEVGGDFVTRWVRLQPHVGYKVLDVRQDGFAENGGVGALDVGSSSFDSQRLVTGIRVLGADAMSRVQPFATVSYEHEYGDRVADLDNALPGLPAYRVLSTRLGRDIFTLQTGAEFQVGKGAALFVTARVSTRTNYDSKSILGGFKVSW